MPLPNASPTLTCTAGAMGTLAATLLGGTRYVSAAAGPGVTVNAAPVTPGNAPAEAVSCFNPARVTLSAANVARPAASLSAPLPLDSTPVPTSASATD